MISEFVEVVVTTSDEKKAPPYMERLQKGHCIYVPTLGISDRCKKNQDSSGSVKFICIYDNCNEKNEGCVSSLEIQEFQCLSFAKTS